MAFSTLCLARLFHGFNCRGKQSIFKLGLFTNKYSWYAFITGVVLVNIVLFVPGVTDLFEVAPLSASNVGLIYLFAFLPTVIIQISKMIRESINK